MRDAAAAQRQLICHGICLAPADSFVGGRRPDEPFAHGWIEDDADDTVGQAGILDGERIWFTVSRPEWYGQMRVQAVTRYRLDDALRLNWQTGHYGPWRPEYRALCGRRQR
jgi:hypothetical protein